MSKPSVIISIISSQPIKLINCFRYSLNYPISTINNFCLLSRYDFSMAFYNSIILLDHCIVYQYEGPFILLSFDSLKISSLLSISVLLILCGMLKMLIDYTFLY